MLGTEPLIAAEEAGNGEAAPAVRRWPPRRLAATTACVLALISAAALAAARAPRASVSGLPRTSAGEGGNDFTFCRPDPAVLVWDEDAEQLARAQGGGAVYVKGWLSVPLIHESELLSAIGLESPRVALRVAGFTDCRPKTRAPLLTHCGGPGSGNDCLSIPHLLPDLAPALDNLAISQRGVVPPRSDRHPPPVPFLTADGLERVSAFPTITCYSAWATPVIDAVRAAYADARIDAAPLDALLATYARKQGGGEMMMLYNSTLVVPYAHLLAASAQECRARAVYRTLGSRPLRPTHAGAGAGAGQQRAQPQLGGRGNSSSAPPPGSRDGTKREPAGEDSVFDTSLGGHESLLDFASTTDLARDLDVLRAAVGSARLSIWGTSYGTVVGGTYATMFSDQMGDLVLDGNVGVENDVYKVGEKLALSYDDVWNGLSAACDASYFVGGARGDAKCAAAPYPTEKMLQLFADPSNVAKVLQLLKTTLDRGITGRGIAPAGAIAMACLESLSSRGDFLGRGCCASEPEVGVLPMPEDEWEDDEAIIQTVRALDIAGRLNPKQIARFYVELGLRHPLGAQGASNVIYISSSPTLPRPTPPFGSPIVAPLIIGTLNDPATTFAAAQDMKSFFPQGTLLTWQGFLHGFRIVNSPPEADEAASDQVRFANGGYGAYVCTQLLKTYLTTGMLPRDGTTCPIDGPGASALTLEMAVAHAGRGEGKTCL